MYPTPSNGPGFMLCCFWIRLFPTSSVPSPWNAVSHSLFHRISNIPLLHSPLGGGTWLPPVAALLPDPSTRAVAAAPAVALAAVAGRGHELTPGQRGTLNPPLDQGVVLSVLGQLLVSAGLPLVEGLTIDQISCLTKLTPGATACTPGAARDVLRSLGVSSSTTVGAVAAIRHATSRTGSTPPSQTFDWLTELQQQLDQLQQPAEDGSSRDAAPAATLLLSYCLSDMGLEKFSSSRNSTPQQQQQQQQMLQLPRELLLQLDGLPLLVMADGSHAKLQLLPAAANNSSSSRGRVGSSSSGGAVPPKYFVAGNDVEQQLLVGAVPGLVVQLELGSKLQQQLLVLATSGRSQGEGWGEREGCSCT